MACDGSGGTEGDVNMDKDEIDRLVKATKAKTEAQGNEDVDMTGASSSGPASYGNGQPSRPTPKAERPRSRPPRRRRKKLKTNGRRKKRRKRTNGRKTRKMPAWATRMVPGCLMHCVDVCHGKRGCHRLLSLRHGPHDCHPPEGPDTVCSTWSLRLCSPGVDLVKNSTTIPEYDTYIPCVGEDESGELSCNPRRMSM